MVISLLEVYGVALSSKHAATFRVHALTAASRKRREEKNFKFKCDTPEDAAKWVDVLQRILARVPLDGVSNQHVLRKSRINRSERLSHAHDVFATAVSVPRRRVLVLINPFGGRKRAPGIWRDDVEPMFQRSTVDCDVVLTQRAGHAIEIAAGVDLDKYDGIVTVSGDGLLHEVINGLSRHADWQRAIQLPIGPIPAGTGNGLVVSMGIWGRVHDCMHHI